MMFVPGYVDHVIIRVEQALFGFQPSLAFMERLPQVWFSELLYAAYFSYYLMISGVGIALFFRNRAQCYHYLAVVSFVFYVLYLTYIFVPVMGPRAFFREIDGYVLPEELQALATNPYFPEALQGGFFFVIMKFIYAHFEAPGAAFPSSHVAVAIVTAWFTWRYLPRLRVVHPIVVLLLCAGTVYGRYHYVVDVLAGALAAAALIPIGNWLHRRFPPGARLLRGDPAA
jgi:membrane-associated phospholipid phosphatase